MNIALHICCGICAAGVVERLTSEGHSVHGYFYNPNIHPEEEYFKRLEAARQVAEKLDFPLEVGPYVPDDWFMETEGFEKEPEGGLRCEICFRHRLTRTWRYMDYYKYDAFTTTLTVSPQKKAAVVNRVGQEIGGDRFLERYFKKKAGFQRSMELAGQWGLYHQDYCGCIYSVRGK